MKIVDRKTFLSLPKNTLFSVFESYSFGPLNIKGDSLSNDYFYQEIHDSIDVKNSDEFISTLSSAKEKGTSVRMDFNCEGRDGCYEDDAFYAVWERQDVEELITRLQKCIE
ncbi:hypothetical protein [Serratia sp. JSRIV004]|uniref:hypothetical protein n=1 Tax=Serratia sp. JSRIV004 TaxID=2831895 RepID=UPI001CBB6D63|nr:hypothetical protein [Serratia sp. JSRIV004]UAN59011.1 hypothetical protein KGP21_08180 [Serratia sp. JSRIV004]UAN59638.1 hypothetical protein KGP21_11555 [Serratia sp. JSRIV004]